MTTSIWSYWKRELTLVKSEKVGHNDLKYKSLGITYGVYTKLEVILTFGTKCAHVKLEWTKLYTADTG